MSSTYSPSTSIPLTIDYFPQDININSLLDALYDHTMVYYNRTHSSFSNKIGKLAGRTIKVFKRDETKVSALISYWATETMLTAIIIMELTSFIGIACALFVYLYGTYALYSAVNTLAKSKD